MPVQWHTWLRDNWVPVVMAVTLTLPLIASTWLRFVAHDCETYLQRTTWIVYARWVSLIMIFEVPVWWSLSTLANQPTTRNLALLASVATWALLLIPLSITMFVARLISYLSDARVFGKRWSPWDIFRLSFWRTISSTLALLMIAVGINDIYERNLVGSLWVFGAGIAALIGKERLRAAEGLKPRPVKSGELYKRALVMSKRMGIPIKRVGVVPFGKGRLTNAYGGQTQIAITDDYGHWLHGSELDYVIAHELAHVKQRDAVKTVVKTAAVFAVFSAATFLIPRPTVPGKILAGFGVILIPLLVYYALSRRREYAADRLAVETTKDPEMAIRALVGLYRRTETPAERSGFLELFSTHPGLWHRIDAIARVGGLSPEHVLQARADFTAVVSGNQ